MDNKTIENLLEYELLLIEKKKNILKRMMMKEKMEQKLKEPKEKQIVISRTFNGSRHTKG